MILTEINLIPRTAENVKMVRIAIMDKECFISILALSSRYYIELSGWYTGKCTWSTSRANPLADVIKEVSRIAVERTIDALDRDNEL